MDTATLWFAFAVASAVGLLSGAAAIAGSGITGRTRQIQHTYRWLLVTGEIAIAFILAVTVSLLGQSMQAISSLPLGFEQSRALSVSFSPNVMKVNRQGGKRRLETELIAAVSAVPGVMAAGIGPPPLGHGLADTTIALSAERSDPIPIAAPAVGPGYFDALGARLVSGRSCPRRAA